MITGQWKKHGSEIWMIMVFLIRTASHVVLLTQQCLSAPCVSVSFGCSDGKLVGDIVSILHCQAQYITVL